MRTSRIVHVGGIPIVMIKSFSPYRPTELVAEAVTASAADVEAATLAARAAQRQWWNSGAAARAAALRAAADRLRARAQQAAELITREVGKPAGEASGEVARAVAILDYYAQASYAATGQLLPPSVQPGLLYTEQRPRGLAGLITPWNFPLAIPLWKAAPALAAGNAVLLKPSPEAVGCAALLVELFAGLLPDGLFANLPGEAETGRAIVDSCDVVSFTGSCEVGRQVIVAAARQGMPVQAEMGGQNAAIVLPDADVEETAAMLAGAAMGYAGQKCTATRRIIVVGDPRPLTDALVAAVRALPVGPVINVGALERVRAAITDARDGGARVLTGGSHDQLFAQPVVLDRLDPSHRVAQDETFGPLVVVLPAPDVATATALANAVPQGLVTSIHGQELSTVLAAVRDVDTGLIRINAPTTGVDFYAPFGGEKESSYGPREQGMSALAHYSSTRTVTLAGAR